MTAKTKALMFAMDSCDAAIARELAEAGDMPNLARLLAGSAAATSRNPYGLFVGSLWISFGTAVSAARIGFHCWEEIDSNSYEWQITDLRQIKGKPFWEALSAAGKRVAVVDVPHSRAASPINGVMVTEYACHDRHFGFHTQPPSLAKELEGRYGLHPILTADPYEVKGWSPDDYMHRAGELRTADEEQALLTGLLDGIERKTKLSADLLAQGGWDLFLTVFCDAHSVGHQQWHIHDPAHPRFDRALADRLGDPVIQVYRRIDAALGEHLAMVDADTSVFVLLSHGMGPHYDGTHLLHEILRRLDRAQDGEIGGSRLMRTAKRGWGRVPQPIRRLVLPGALSVLRHRVARNPLPPVPDWTTAEERASQRFFLSPNDTAYGGVRINLAGREPRGRVRPGAEFDAVCARLTDDLLALVNVETGGPVVRGVARTDDHYDREESDNLPDLLIDWAHDAPVETVWSPNTGIVYGPYTHWRTGDHRPDGLLLARGPGITPGASLPPVHMVDLGASLSARLGVELTGDIDGRPVPWIANAPTQVGVS